uniref:NADH dehydrogenase subunit 4L n=1 Tax=Trichinella nativa TaxID=6335 RepID=A0A0A0V2X7_9BILA|nr:NADH dehydrogenase subunit 4L [Trichinella nativa]AIW57000.1 NADH dehydrogenase subunit 4L [Trichinella nativa]BAV82880.1 NADH dehydrogenase subunit 4L [Trichinella nativa]
MVEVLMFVVGLVKVIVNLKSVVVLLISMELLSLALMCLCWGCYWVYGVWFLMMMVVHSVVGMLVLLWVIRYFGSDKVGSFV